MSLNQPDIGAAFRKSLHDHWRAFLIEGVIVLMAGLVGGHDKQGRRFIHLAVCCPNRNRHPALQFDLVGIELEAQRLEKWRVHLTMTI